MSKTVSGFSLDVVHQLCPDMRLFSFLFSKNMQRKLATQDEVPMEIHVNGRRRVFTLREVFPDAHDAPEATQ